MNVDYFKILKNVDLDEVDSTLQRTGYYILKNISIRSLQSL